MSFGYLIITARPCPALNKMRTQSFTLLSERAGRCVYFRFCENGIYTERRGETESVLNGEGARLLQDVYHANQGAFVFADVLLQSKEGEADFAANAAHRLDTEKIPALKIRNGLPLCIRQPYFIGL